jgi:hypothetical protein
MNAKNVAPLVATLPAIAAAAPPLIIGGAIFVGGIYFLEWLFSDDDKEKQPESAPAPSAPAAPPRLASVIPSVSGGNSGQNACIPPNSAKKNTVPPPLPPVMINPVPTVPEKTVPPPSVIPALKAAPEIPLPARKKFITLENMANVFHRGANTLTRKAAVAALRKLGFGKTAAYDALSPDGRFATWLQYAPDGIILWKS